MAYSLAIAFPLLLRFLKASFMGLSYFLKKERAEDFDSILSHYNSKHLDT
jgi:hypothetical protein